MAESERDNSPRREGLTELTPEELFTKFPVGRDNPYGVEPGLYQRFEEPGFKAERIGDLPETDFREGDRVRLLNDKLVLMAKEGDELVVAEIEYDKVSAGQSRQYLLKKEGSNWMVRAGAADFELIERGPHWEDRE